MQGAVPQPGCRNFSLAANIRLRTNLDGTEMEFPRRTFLRLATGAAAVPARSRFACAQSYPSRPVRWIVPYTPGGSADLVARLIAQFLSERLGQQFIIEPGAAVNIGAEAVAKATPDGHTLLVVAANNTINATLYDKLPFDFIHDIAPGANMVRTPLVMLVSPSFPANTVSEFIAYARANPEKLIMASGGHGALTHMTGELFKAMTGVRMHHAPYRGEPLALHDLMGGQGNCSRRCAQSRTCRQRQSIQS